MAWPSGAGERSRPRQNGTVPRTGKSCCFLLRLRVSTPYRLREHCEQKHYTLWARGVIWLVLKQRSAKVLGNRGGPLPWLSLVIVRVIIRIFRWIGVVHDYTEELSIQALSRFVQGISGSSAQSNDQDNCIAGSRYQLEIRDGSCDWHRIH